MKCPIIGISGSMMFDTGGSFPGYPRSYVNHDYIEAVLMSGGIPLIIAMHEKLSMVQEQVALIDGLILSGGYDVDPLLYQQEPLEKLGSTLPKRDAFDLQLIKDATARDLPILGICRGMQILNVAAGGTLYQDLSYCKTSTIKHVQGHSPDLTTHHITIDPSSQLYSILARQEIVVNSFHHQIIQECASSFYVTARAQDGVVEAIESREKGFVLGVQWHPEMLCHENALMRRLFEVFIKKAKERTS